VVIGFALTFLPQFQLGLDGMPRRIADYALYAPHAWTRLNELSTLGAFILGIAGLLFIWNVVASLHHGRPAGNDPWGANSLEWFTTSPPPQHNFHALPLVHSERPVYDYRHDQQAHAGAGKHTDPQSKPTGASDRERRTPTMTDEAAVWLRIFAFGLVASAIYWFVSHEPVGTVALLVFGLGPGVAGLYLYLHQRATTPKESWAVWLRRFAGVAKDRPQGPAELEAHDLGAVPAPSIWPFLLSLGLTVAVTGLAFGLWLVLLGSAILVLSVVGWLATINHETRHSGLRNDQQP
jgi:Cytochrome c oxidase subunit IV